MVGPSVTVIVPVPDPAKLWGLNEADAPVGNPPAPSPIAPLTPVALRETEYTAVPAGPIDWDDGDALMKKLLVVTKAAVTLLGPVIAKV